MNGNAQKRPIGFRTFRQTIRLSKYAQWAKDLTAEQLLALFEAVGEYGYRSERVLDILRKRSRKRDYSCARAVAALEVIAEFTQGNPVKEEELAERIRRVPNNAGAMLASKLTNDKG